MTIALPGAPGVAPSAPRPILPLRQFTVAEYHRMIETRVLTEDDPVELLEGWIVQKIPRNPPHDGTVALTNKALSRRLPPGWHVRIQSAITTSDSEPEPDLAVARGVEEDYLVRHPGPADLALVVEVADSTLDRDREEKARIYARAGIRAYWIVNLVDRRVEVYTDPSGAVALPAYRNPAHHDRNAMLPLNIDGDALSIPVLELLP